MFWIPRILLFSLAPMILSCSHVAKPSMQYVPDSDNLGGCITVKNTNEFQLDVFAQNAEVANLQSSKGSVVLCIKWRPLVNETDYSVVLTSNGSLVYESSSLTESELEALMKDLNFRRSQTEMLQVGVYSFGGKTLKDSVFSIGVPPN